MKEYQYFFTGVASPILDLNLNSFIVDMNGMPFAWQGVLLLPFIDKDRLLAATMSICGCIFFHLYSLLLFTSKCLSHCVFVFSFHGAGALSAC
jgi:hypothetical protein